VGMGLSSIPKLVIFETSSPQALHSALIQVKFDAQEHTVCSLSNAKFTNL